MQERIDDEGDAAYGREAEIAALGEYALRPRDTTIVVTLTVKGNAADAKAEALKRLTSVLNEWFCEPTRVIEGFGYPDGTLLLWGIAPLSPAGRPE